MHACVCVYLKYGYRTVLVTFLSEHIHFRSNFAFKSVFYTEWPSIHYTSSSLTWRRTKIVLEWDFFLCRLC